MSSMVFGKVNRNGFQGQALEPSCQQTGIGAGQKHDEYETLVNIENCKFPGGPAYLHFPTQNHKFKSVGQHKEN